jgi:hypothetical protein
LASTKASPNNLLLHQAAELKNAISEIKYQQKKVPFLLAASLLFPLKSEMFSSNLFALCKLPPTKLA